METMVIAGGNNDSVNSKKYLKSFKMVISKPIHAYQHLTEAR